MAATRQTRARWREVRPSEPMVATPSAAQLRSLAACEGRLRAPGFTPGRWHDLERRSDGALHMPWFEHSPDMRALVAAMVAAIPELDRDWMSWAATSRGRQLLEDPGLVYGASPVELASLVTACVRGDRFTEGSLAEAVERGTLAAIFSRADELARSLEQGGAA